jgi:DNA-binding response OmpR family regulator
MKQRGIPKVILIIEQDRILREAMSQVLRRQGHVVLAIADGTTAISLADENPLSLMILDAALLRSDGSDLSHQLRVCAQAGHVPLLLLASKQDEMVSLWMKNIEADDFITKPFLWEEFHACVTTLLRSGNPGSRRQSARISRRPLSEICSEQELVLVAQDLRINVARHEVVHHGRPIEVKSALLFALLVYLVRHRGAVLSRDQLLTQVWGYTRESVQQDSSRTVAVHIHWLRELLEDDPTRPQLIQTIRGAGYRFTG